MYTSEFRAIYLFEELLDDSDREFEVFNEALEKLKLLDIPLCEVLRLYP
jgi:hypothetical protein